MANVETIARLNPSDLKIEQVDKPKYFTEWSVPEEKSVTCPLVGVRTDNSEIVKQEAQVADNKITEWV